MGRTAGLRESHGQLRTILASFFIQVDTFAVFGDIVYVGVGLPGTHNYLRCLAAPVKYPGPFLLLFPIREVFMLNFRMVDAILFREDAYRSYCWNVDVYGANQPTSFIYLCFESFRDLMKDYGVNLTRLKQLKNENEVDWDFEWKYQRKSCAKDDFDGAVVYLSFKEAVPLAQVYLSQGKNVLLLIPNSEIDIYFYSFRDDKFQEVLPKIDELGISDCRSMFDIESSTEKKIPKQLWREVGVPQGRLFVADDGFLSDGSFMKNYGKSEERTLALNHFAKEFSVLKQRIVSIEVLPVLERWVTGVQTALNLKIKNHGFALKNLDIEVSLHRSVTMLSSCFFQVDEMEPGTEITLPIQLSFNVIGSIDPVLNVNVSAEAEPVRVRLISRQVSVLESGNSSMVRYSPKDSSDFTFLKTLSQKSPLMESLKNIGELAQIDPAVCLNKIRTVTEGVYKRLYQKLKNTQIFPSLSDMIREVSDERVLSQKAISYSHTIRLVGNAASHSSGVPLDLDDVRAVSYAFVSLMEELLEKKFIQ